MTPLTRSTDGFIGPFCLLVLVSGLVVGMSVVDPLRNPQGRKPPPADNFLCLDCHLNYGFDPFAEGHRKAGIGCVRCHGESEAHLEDEEATNAPDRMYAKERIDASCLGCHALAQLRSSCVIDANKRVCTDCHDTHRLLERKRRWDKNTRKLIYSDGGAGMDEGMDDEMGMDMM